MAARRAPSHPQVRLLSGKRFELREDTAFELEIAEPGAFGGPPQETVPETVTETVAAARGSFVVVDLETNPDRAAVADHEIIEIGACSIENGEVVERFARLVAPTRPLMPEITKLTGLTADELANGLPPEEALHDLRTFCGELPVVAHNGFGYDFVVLDGLAARLGVEALANERLDTLELAHVVFPRTGYDILPGLDGSVPPRAGPLMTWLSTSAFRRHSETFTERSKTLNSLQRYSKSSSQSCKGRVVRVHCSVGYSTQARAHGRDSLTAQRADNLVDLLIEPPTAPFDPPPEDDGFDLSEAVAPVAEEGPSLWTAAGNSHSKRRWRAWSPGRCTRANELLSRLRLVPARRLPTSRRGGLGEGGTRTGRGRNSLQSAAEPAAERSGLFRKRWPNRLGAA